MSYFSYKLYLTLLMYIFQTCLKRSKGGRRPIEWSVFKFFYLYVPEFSNWATGCKQNNWRTVNFFSPCTRFRTLQEGVQASFGTKLINVMQKLKSICSRIVCCKLGYVCSSTIWKYFSREHIACLCNHLSDRKIALLTPDCKTSFACLLAAEKVFLKLLSLTGFSALIVKMIKRSFSYRLAWLLRLLSLMVFVLYLGKSHTD